MRSIIQVRKNKFLIFCLAGLITGVGFLLPEVCVGAEQENGHFQLVYEVKVLELKQHHITQMGLERFFVESDEGREDMVFVFSEESLLDILFPASRRNPLSRILAFPRVLMINLESMEGQETSITKIKPRIVTLPGKKVTLSVLQEEIDFTGDNRSVSGIELSLKPLEIKDDMIFSQVEFAMLPGVNDVKTELWVSEDEFKPVAVVQQKETGRKNFPLAQVDRNRYFAFYLRCSIREMLDEEKMNIGDIGGLADFLFHDDSGERKNYLKATLPVNRWGANLFLSCWPTDQINLRARGDFRFNPCYELGFQVRLFDEELSMGAKFLHFPGRESYLAFGLSDRVELSSNITLHAGYYPLNFDISRWLVRQTHWWFGTELNWQRITLNLEYSVAEGWKSFTSTLGYRLTGPVYFLGEFSHNLAGEKALSLGFGLEF